MHTQFQEAEFWNQGKIEFWSQEVLAFNMLIDFAKLCPNLQPHLQGMRGLFPYSSKGGLTFVLRTLGSKSRVLRGEMT